MTAPARPLIRRRQPGAMPASLRRRKPGQPVPSVSITPVHRPPHPRDAVGPQLARAVQATPRPAPDPAEAGAPRDDQAQAGAPAPPPPAGTQVPPPRPRQERALHGEGTSRGTRRLAESALLLPIRPLPHPGVGVARPEEVASPEEDGPRPPAPDPRARKRPPRRNRPPPQISLMRTLPEQSRLPLPLQPLEAMLPPPFLRSRPFLQIPLAPNPRPTPSTIEAVLR